MSVTAKGPQTGRTQFGAHRHGSPVRRAMRGARVRLAALAWHVDGREALLATMTVACNVLASLAGLALAFADGRFALWAGVPAVACWVVMVWLAEIEPVVHDDAGKGEVANLSHEEFECLLEQVELSAATEPARSPDDGERFEQLVRDALDELPDFIQASLRDNVAVVISDDGAEHPAYGLYHGGTVVHGWRHTILIYRDTLVRDFGHDPDELRRQVAITVRHEVAHHLGASEHRVAELGL